MLDRAAPLSARYDRGVRSLLVVLVVACGSSPARTPAPAQPTPAPRDLAVAEPPPKQPPPARRFDPDDPVWLVDRHTIGRRLPPATQELAVAQSQSWSACVRAYVEALPPHARRPVTAAFARYEVTCDAERRVVVAPPRDHVRQPSISFAGPLATIGLQVSACRAFDGFAILYDGKRWDAGVLATEERAGCTVAALPNTPSMRAMLRDVVAARHVALRFDGDDVVLADGLKFDLRLMLDALDALTAR